jgi:hypothetical protein
MQARPHTSRARPPSHPCVPDDDVRTSPPRQSKLAMVCPGRCPICGTGLAAGSPEAGPTRGAGRLVLQESKNATLDHMEIVWRMPVLLLECRCVLLLRALCLLRTFFWHRTFPPRTRFLMHRGRIFLLEKNPLNDEFNEGTPLHLIVDELVDCLLGHTWTPRLTLILNNALQMGIREVCCSQT